MRKWTAAEWMLVVGVIPALIFAITVAGYGLLLARQGAANQNGLDVGAGFAELFGIILVPVGCWTFLALALTRLEQPTLYWSGTALLLPAALGMFCVGVIFSPINSPETTSFGPLLLLFLGGISYLAAAVTGVLGWRMRAAKNEGGENNKSEG